MGSFLNGKHTLILNSEHCRVSVGFENSPVESATVMQWVDFVFLFFWLHDLHCRIIYKMWSRTSLCGEITNSIKHLQMTLFLLSLRCKSWEDLRLDERPVHSRKQHLVFFCLPLLTLTPFQAHERTELRTLADQAAQNTCFRKETFRWKRLSDSCFS